MPIALMRLSLSLSLIVCLIFVASPGYPSITTTCRELPGSRFSAVDSAHTNPVESKNQKFLYRVAHPARVVVLARQSVGEIIHAAACYGLAT